MSKTDPANEFEYLNQMSSEQLRELLRLEIDSDQDNDELVFRILEVIKQRRETEDPAGRPTTEQAWSDFQKYYNTPDGKGQTLYPTEAVSKMNTKVPSTRRYLRWVTAAAAILILVVFVTPPVLGYTDVWDMVTEWTDEVYMYRHRISNNSTYEIDTTEHTTELKDLHDALKNNGITEKLAPNWLPDRFVLDSLIVDYRNASAQTNLNALYKTPDDTFLSITIIQRSTHHTQAYEKDSTDVVLFPVNGITHQIFTNYDQIVASWYNQNFEVMITGNITQEEIERVITSIYERTF